MANLQGKVALVTGAARGIGRAISERLAGAGARLALCDVKEEWLAETAAAVRAKGSADPLCLACDVSRGADVERAVAAVLDGCGALDVLVNNAGITRDGLLVRMSEEDWDAVLSINLRGTFLFTKAAARPMMKRRSGAVVNIASIIGLIGNAGQCNYAASKAGVIALTKSAAKELAPRGVRVNAVAPGFIESKMTEVLADEVRKRMLDAIPLQRFGLPADVAAVVEFLAGDEAAYITGEVINVSGGMVM